MDQLKEYIQYDAKALEKLLGSKSDLVSLAQHCVAFANAQWWIIEIGRNNDGKAPEWQKIDINTIQQKMKQLRWLMYWVIINDTIKDYTWNSQTLLIEIYPTMSGLASTSDGKYYVRKNDESIPVRPEDMTHLVATKQQTQREIQLHEVSYSALDQTEIKKLCNDLRDPKNTRVSDFIKNKSDYELCHYYGLIIDDKVSNLWILRCGTFEQRMKLHYPISVQYIVYDHQWNKVRKQVRDKPILNPKELLLDIEKQAIELAYYHEFSSGLFREQIRLYPQAVIRELLVNAFAHKSYTISADIFINVYPDSIQIHSPWWLPLWVTSSNILHTRVRRNPKIIDLFRDLNLMEWEWSWFDLIFELLAKNGKQEPVVSSDFDRVIVSIDSKISNIEHIKLMQYIVNRFPDLSQREWIALGIIWAHLRIWATDLYKKLQLNTNDAIKPWVIRLIDRWIITIRWTKKWSSYMINELLIKDLELQKKPSLKLTTPETLQELIKRAMKQWVKYSMKELYDIFKQYDIIKKEFENIVRKMAQEWFLWTEWWKAYRKYILK